MTMILCGAEEADPTVAGALALPLSTVVTGASVWTTSSFLWEVASSDINATVDAVETGTTGRRNNYPRGGAFHSRFCHMLVEDMVRQHALEHLGVHV
jgi:hypothetical protein